MPRYHSVVASAVACFALAAGAAESRAQLTVNSVDTRTIQLPDTDFFGPLNATNNGVTGNLLTMKGDYNQPLPRGDAPDIWTMGREVFDVGPIPIEVYNLTLSVNAKWVNGGGNDEFARTSWTVLGRIREYSEGSFTGGITVRETPSITGELIGNGFRVVDEGKTLPGSYVLAANRRYVVSITSITVMNALNAPATIPSMTITHEFGGITDYRGYDISFSWRTVPTPGAAALAAIAIPMVTRRRRA